MNVTFVSAKGDEEVIDIDAGVSVMEGAVRGGIDGIDADCGGQLSCATCHIYLDAEWMALVPGPSEDETDLLEFAPGRGERSRLSCQIIVGPSLEGLVVRIPETQG